MRRRKCSGGFIFIAFGIGLFFAYCFPAKALIIALAAVLIATGIFLIKGC